jgi:ribose/xylose/arabinose/galactoside ABC-type transport system permease subunit
MVVLLLTIGVVSGVNPAFLSVQNFSDLLVQAAPVIIIGCGMTLVVLTGEIDISVGSLYGLLAALLGILSSPAHQGLSGPVAIAITLGAGAGVGLINGLLVTLARVPSIIATLGMLTILRGLTEILMGGEWITDLPPTIRWFGTAEPGGAPFCLWIAAVVVAGSLLLTRRTRIGLRVYAVGGNPDAAAYARISCTRIRLFAFTLTGFLTGVATLVTVPQLSVIESGIGSGLELVIVTAVLVGGTSLRGGHGGIVGTVVAALLLGSVRTALVFLNLGEMATYWERAIQGAFILGAVLADHLAGRSPSDAAPGRGAPA